ncbi:MAG: hypothetical protein Q7J78_01250 [Clostridiales bacterium]|nr:hypothetical protein [Clostridiales bacterium]
MKESRTMRELHEIREKHYESTKDMTSEEYVMNVRQGASKAKKRIEEIRKSKSKVV